MKNGVIKDIIRSVILELLEELLTNGIILINKFFLGNVFFQQLCDYGKKINLYYLDKLHNSLNAGIVLTACI